MSAKHPIIAITGSSGAGTTSVMRTFDAIFRREGVSAAFVEGDAFHRYDRAEMKTRMAEELARGNQHFSHFSPETNLFAELEALFRDYGESGRGRARKYLHSDEEAAPHAQPPGTFTPWEDLSWIQKLHRDRAARGYSTEAVTNTILRRMPDYAHYIIPQFAQTHINFQRVPVVDTSNPFVARHIPSADESFLVIRFANPRGIDFPYLLTMLHDSFMSRPNTIVAPGGKMDLAMQLIFTPMIWRLMERRKLALGKS